jgi:hypothetical protein
VPVVGYKQPRWPECFRPGWTSEFSSEQLQAAILRLVEAEVGYARAATAITRWQVENEPFVRFGTCESTIFTPAFLQDEVSLVQSLDGRRVLLTDSGEGSTLAPAMSVRGNVDLGLSIYRDVPWPVIGMVRYPLPAWSYAVRARVARLLIGAHGGETIIAELQTEGWFLHEQGLKAIAAAEQRAAYPPEQIILANVEYGRRIGFRQAYLWGVEWWYWMAAQGDASYVDAARAVFRTSG